MKYQYKNLPERKNLNMRSIENKFDNVSINYNTNYQEEYNFNRVKAKELSKKMEDTTDLVIEDNTVYEIDKECLSCNRNYK